MKKTISGALRNLTEKEKKIFWFQSAAEIVLSLADILFLAGLVLLMAQFAGGSTIIQTYLPEGALHEKPLLLPGIFVFSWLIKNFLAVYLLHSQYTFFYKVATRLSSANLNVVLHEDYATFIKTDSAVYTRQIAQQPVEFAQYILRSVQQILTQSILIAVSIIALLIWNTVLFLMLTATLLPVFLIVYYFSKRTEVKARSNIRSFSERSMQYLREALAGYVENKIYAKNRFLANRYIKYQEKLNRVLGQRQVLQGSTTRAVEIFALLGMFTLLMINQYFPFAVSTTTIAAFTGAAYKLIPGMIRIMNNLGQVKAYEFTIEQPEGSPLQSTSNADILKINSLSIQNVSFSYGNKKLLKNISFHLEGGDIAGISGYSGSGKTTLVNILLGFLKPAIGKTLFNNEPVSAETAWSRISYVRQQPFLIHDTSEKNITLSDDAAETERFTNIISRVGLNGTENFSSVYENGGNFSGGQRQRLSLARALYKDADVFILDEAFSELDEQAENEMLCQLKQLAAEGKIILLITHNQHALSICNKIISLE